jgi:hypothetical protein
VVALIADAFGIGESEPGLLALTTEAAQKILEYAKDIYRSYMATAEMTDDVIRAAVFLARLDWIYRSGYVDLASTFGPVAQPLIDELRELCSLLDRDVFKAKAFCVLNPTFGEASQLVGGADADVVIDDTIIEVKTVKDGRLDPRMFRQLIGYYILNQIGGINGDRNRIGQIRHLGVYFSRHGELLKFSAASVMKASSNLWQLVQWFKSKAEQYYGTNEYGSREEL